MTPTTPFRCVTYSCVMQAQHCVQRQGYTYSYSNGHGPARQRIPPHLRHCASGKCAQGARIKLKLAGKEIRPVPKITAEFMRALRARMRKHDAKSTLACGSNE